MRATRVTSLEPLMNCPLESLQLPGSPVTFLGSISTCPIRELNIVGLKIEDFACLQQMPLKSLALSPDKLSSSDFEILLGLNLDYLQGPGDPKDQRSTVFMEKYSSQFQT
jgi:hypothetical protein